MDRTALLLGDSGPATRILEIGPSHAPIAPKRAGWNAFVVDHASAEELRAKYTGHPVDLDAIEEVDAVWAGGRLDDAIPAALHGSFGRLIASHVLEHIPDPVTFLVSAQRLLAPDGTVALAVPDKRYCFDALKPVATTADLLAAHQPDGAGRHTARTHFQQVAYSAFYDGAGAWGQHPVTSAALVNTLPEALSAYAAARDTVDSPYVDAHAWQFTPHAFRLAILELAESGLIDWHIADCTQALGAEFIATLRRGRLVWATPQAREAERLRLLLGVMDDLREQIDFAAQGGLLPTPPLPTDPAIARAIAALRADSAARTGELAAIAATLHDINGTVDDQQRALATIIAEDGTQASIMRALADIAIRQDHQQQHIAALAAQLAAQHAQIASMTAADGTQAALLHGLQVLGERQTHLHQAIEDAARAAHAAPTPVLQALGPAIASFNSRLDALAARLDAQQARLEDVHRNTSRLARLLRPFLRLRARITGRPFIE